MRSKESAGSMPTYHSVKNQLYRSRQAVFPGLPSRRRTITFPEEYQKTNSGEQFLLIDDGDDDKIIGFATRSNLEYLSASEVLYGDGTFFVSPKLFTQLYTIHAKVSDQMFPLVFLLLPNKTTDTYTRAFRLVKETAARFGLQLNPDKIQMDFEMAARNAALTVFPTATWKGCFFHYAQCIWRKVQKCGLQVEYKNDFEVSKFVRRCATNMD